jgi:hypothetical protein
MRTSTLFLGAFVLLTAGAASAARPCGADIDKFCAQVEAGGGRIAKCLKEHENDLSAECRDHLKEVKGKLEEIHKDCQGDVDNLCKDVKPGAGRILRCLHQNKDKVSAACKDAMKGAHKR